MVLRVILSIRREEDADETKLTRWNTVISALRDRKWQFPPMTGYRPVSAAASRCRQAKKKNDFQAHGEEIV